MAISPTCIIVYTREDGSLAEVRAAASELARSAHAKLILYDIDAAPGGLGQLTNPLEGVPLPTNWSGDGDKENFATPGQLGPDELERAGRRSIATQVREARSMGIDAYGWLPSTKSGGGLAEYAEEQSADLIMVPSDLGRPNLMKRMRGETTAKVIDRAEAAVAVVHRDGRVEYAAQIS
jgi:nucleotide-binding universal stress UspA family protein